MSGCKPKANPTGKTAGWEIITPAIAKKILKNNPHGHKSLNSFVFWLATQILNGNVAKDEFLQNQFCYVAIHSDGSLASGAPFLKAVLMANKPCPALVYRGSEHPGEQISALEYRVLFCNSYAKLPAVIAEFEEHGHTDEWWALFGHAWVGSDNCSVYIEEITNILKSADDKQLALIMDDEETALFNELPDTLTVYRGCDKDSENGLSWSLDKGVASTFPFMERYAAKNPVLRTMVIPKSSVLFAKLASDEKEIVTFQNDGYTEEPLEKITV